MIRFVIDSSALLALLRNERGGASDGPILAEAAMSTVNLSEVVAHYSQSGSSEADIRSLLEGLEFARVPFDDDLAYAAGMLIPMTRPAGLSFGDRADPLGRRQAQQPPRQDQVRLVDHLAVEG